MKYDTVLALYGHVYGHYTARDVKDKKMRKAIMKEYRAIMERASDIGSHNMLISSYCLGGYFIAMNRVTGLPPMDNYHILDKNMRSSKMLKKFLGTKEQYCSEKKMAQRRKWSEETHKKLYKNDWVVDIIENNKNFRFGYDYWECGVCKLCQDEGCPELAKYLCKLDYMLIKLVGLRLERTGTLAEGAPKCDFRFMD